jgi:hypothetical protein
LRAFGATTTTTARAASTTATGTTARRQLLAVAAATTVQPATAAITPPREAVAPMKTKVRTTAAAMSWRRRPRASANIQAPMGSA